MVERGSSSIDAVGPVHRFTETPDRFISLFLRSSGRKTASHFSWNCSSRIGIATANKAPIFAHGNTRAARQTAYVVI
ncbi:MAG: hypothetical protein EOQ30_03925 [Mesorhizobium sp.]|nr:MAG: hypothetical protein EOQ29_01200 [Mesorhizobium sp.]RWA85942.1 MAG: hypothetical protein EOQ30_03925 [Mesorhizobium sp.]